MNREYTKRSGGEVVEHQESSWTGERPDRD